VGVGRTSEWLVEAKVNGVTGFEWLVYWLFVMIVGLHVLRHTKARFEVAFAWQVHDRMV
jgi:hypothetical protein